MADHKFNRKDLTKLLDSIIGRSLGEIDENNVFKKTLSNPKITGIAGDVIEQSVLGYPPDNKQKPDLLVDGKEIELKTTGLKRSKKKEYTFEAKEPMSITAVSPNKIVEEEFFDSALWHKLERMLLIYYLYDSDKTVCASDYANFIIQNYQFHEFNEEDQKILMNDWEIVRDFIRDVKKNKKNIAEEYPKISKLREKMLYMDTAPKYPNPPRFRLKRQVVSTIAQKQLGKNFELLSGKNKFTNYTELDNILHTFTTTYKNKSIENIADDLKIDLKKNNAGTVNKAITEKILTAAFGVKTDKLRKIDTFAKIGTIPKTLTITGTEKRTEDIKFDTIDFSEWTNKDICFEDSSLYNFFSTQTFLFSVFQEAYNNSPLEKNHFIGFKRLSFDDDFIFEHVKPTWDKVRSLIFEKTFCVKKMLDSEGQVRYNKTGVPMEINNFPKSKDYVIFLRGTSSDSTYKPLSINGYKLYQQQFWIKGKVLVELLSKKNYI